MSNLGKDLMAIVFIIAALLLLGLLTAPLVRPRVSPPHANCSNNLHQLGLTVDSYTCDHAGRYPDPDDWPQQIIGYVKTQAIFRCSKTDYDALRKHRAKAGNWEGPLVVTYAMNERLKGLSVEDVKKPEVTVLLFESNGEKLSGGPELLPKETRHYEKRYLVTHEPYVNVLFADWHVKRVPFDEVRSLKWDPR